MLGAPSRPTSVYRNKNRGRGLFRDCYYFLLEGMGQQVQMKRTKFKIKSKILLLDATTISLCLGLFDRAGHKTRKVAVKMHTLLDYDVCGCNRW
ncbi:MAG: hypothetical protein CR994_05635 [Maribacter sp.]|nr:MAG: hypothetical protein CR994_05635 [Maribacter sp.]